MERKIVIAGMHKDYYQYDGGDKSPIEHGFEAVIDAFNDGWVLDKDAYASGGRGQPMRADLCIVYHFVKYTQEELDAIAEAEREAAIPERERKVAHRIKTGDQETINLKLTEGYTIINEWSKETLLYLYEEDMPKLGDHIDDVLAEQPGGEQPNE